MTRTRFAIDSAHGLAFLLAVMSFAGLWFPELYARETPSWARQALAQDLFDLAIAAPCLWIAATLARRSSRPALLVLAGAQLFAAYTLAIYCFAVHVNALFLIYCAAFGLAAYGFVVALWRLVEDAPPWRGTVLRRPVASVLIGVGVLFGALWLAQLIPAIGGTPPRELADTGLASNPVHVLDLSLVLPLHVVAGVALLRRRPLGLVLAPVLLAFGALMAGSIALLGVMAGQVPIAAAMGSLAAISGVLLALVLRAGSCVPMAHVVQLRSSCPRSID